MLWLTETGVLLWNNEISIVIAPKCTVVVKHLHGLLEIVKLFWVDSPDLVVGHASAHDQFVQLLCRRVLARVEQFGCKLTGKRLTDLGVLQTLVDSPLVLAVGRVEVVLDAVVGPTGQLLRDVRPLVAQLLVQLEDHPLLLAVDWVLLDVRV